MIVTRFAPSPTGYLHIGGLRTALFNYLYARQNGGKFLLRIEDTDLSRNSTSAKDAIIRAFEWVGLDFDGEIIYQSKRFDLYEQYAKQLVAENKAYFCYMSKEELETLRQSQRALGQTPRYDNRYRDFSGEFPKDIKPVIRIKAPLDGEISFYDGLKGEIKINAKELDDFIIMRSDGSPTYNFVVAVDDALMGISDVIRGDDHLSNTPKQIIIYNALNFKIPRFFHVPMILNPQGHKLSKRDGAMSVMDYKDMGYLPEALLNFLVRLGWSSGYREIFTLNEMLELFNPNELNTSPSAYNADKLLWLNQHYLKDLSLDSINNLLNFYKPTSLNIVKNLNEKAQNILYCEIKERAKTLLEFCEMLDSIFGEIIYDEKMREKNLKNVALLAEFLAFFISSAKYADEILQDFAKSKNMETKNLFMPLRFALLGKSGGIGIIPLLQVLEREKIISRLQNAIAILK